MGLELVHIERVVKKWIYIRKCWWNILSKQKIEIHFPELSFSVEELLEMRCYEALCKIKAVLEDESLTDEVCFQKIEEIINIFEEIGSDGGSRHDFG